jgi:hypothetical protein
LVHAGSIRPCQYDNYRPNIAPYQERTGQKVHRTNIVPTTKNTNVLQSGQNEWRAQKKSAKMTSQKKRNVGGVVERLCIPSGAGRRWAESVNDIGPPNYVGWNLEAKLQI